MDIIARDILRLEHEKGKCREGMKTLYHGIKELRREQTELQDLLSTETNYDKEALQNNIKRIDFHIGQIEATINKEEAKIRQLDYMINVLRRKQCLSDPISASTGTPPPE